MEKMKILIIITIASLSLVGCSQDNQHHGNKGVKAAETQKAQILNIDDKKDNTMELKVVDEHGELKEVKIETPMSQPEEAQGVKDNTEEIVENKQELGENEDIKLYATNLYFRNLWGYSDIEGNIKIEPQFKYASNFKRGLASVQTLDGKWGYIDNTGEFVIEPKYDYAGDFCIDKDTAEVSINGNWVKIDNKGTVRE